MAQHQARGDRPDAQRKLAALHEAPGAEREVLLAGAATIRHGLGRGMSWTQPTAWQRKQLRSPSGQRSFSNQRLAACSSGNLSNQLYKAHAQRLGSQPALVKLGSRVGEGVTAPLPSQTRACASNALGSSQGRFAQENSAAVVAGRTRSRGRGYPISANLFTEVGNSGRPGWCASLAVRPSPPRWRANGQSSALSGARVRSLS